MLKLLNTSDFDQGSKNGICIWSQESLQVFLFIYLYDWMYQFDTKKFFNNIQEI